MKDFVWGRVPKNAPDACLVACRATRKRLGEPLQGSREAGGAARPHRLDSRGRDADLTRRFDTIGLEDLNVRVMMANRRAARSIAGMSLYEFRQQVAHMADMGGSRVVVADHWLQSRKTRSGCGHKVDVMPLDVRLWLSPSGALSVITT